ncbi:hypothetical protein PCL1606_52260 [Pseudomonas chlororaphis]|uniref:Uncharacterized protein n=1 Tax=Pseudomonas chlororaphis TaxID=587753 RepID=A0A0D5Y5T9_9PSED|nr:hypothetical protein PCL1606_52260 [Pseudomonas chlororaphis]
METLLIPPAEWVVLRKVRNAVRLCSGWPFPAPRRALVQRCRRSYSRFFQRRGE